MTEAMPSLLPGQEKLAEREGFEPSVGFSHARFPGVCLKPLSHLSAKES